MIYLDNAATTKTAPEVVDAMLPYFSEYYGNASTIYSLGAESKKAMDHAARPSQTVWVQSRKRSILLPAVPSPITGR